MANEIITRPGSRVEIRKPTEGGSCTPNNFGQTYTRAETEATRYRDLYVDGKLFGYVEKQDGAWWVQFETSPHYDLFELAGGFRSTAKALDQVETHVDAAVPTKAGA